MARISLPPTLTTAIASSTNTISNDMKSLITIGKDIFHTSFMNTTNSTTSTGSSDKKTAWVVTAPGCINLIGDHTDYTNSGGCMIPFAINKNTICYGTGHYHTSTSTATTQISIKCIFTIVDTITEATEATKASLITSKSEIYERHISCSTTSGDLDPPVPTLQTEDNGNSTTTTNASNNTMDTWMNSVAGTVIQFVSDIPHEGCVVDLTLSFCTNIPFSSTNLLSTNASIEVVTALFLECILQEMAYSSVSSTTSTGNGSENNTTNSIKRALRCNRAETEWALNPCSIVDQIASSCTIDSNFVVLDTSTMLMTHIPFSPSNNNNVDDTEEDTNPVFVICNSGINTNTDTDIVFGIRRRECHDSVDSIQSVPLYHVESLRDATVGDLDVALQKNKLDETLYKRSYHVVTENRRVNECKTALKLQLYDKVGILMNQSHTSLRDNFEVSCKEIDFLVNIAQNFSVTEENEELQVPVVSMDETTLTTTTTTTSPTTNSISKKVVYGCRMTGNGFGGCIISFVKNKKYALQLIQELQTKYNNTNNTDFDTSNSCECFITIPSSGPHIIAVDTI